MKQDYSGILDFFATGRLSELHPGLRLDDVYACIGMPSEVENPAVLNWNDEHILRLSNDLKKLNYGCLSLYFYQDTLHIIKISPHLYPEYSLPGALNTNWLPVFTQMTARSFLPFKREHELEVYVHDYDPDYHVMLVVAPHDVILFFDCTEYRYDASPLAFIMKYSNRRYSRTSPWFPAKK